jgi:tRNA A37 threonylcarbamoyladenosine synthetase subunit TsaC/SUA5/YrdC
VNAGACPCGVESTVVDLTAGVRVLREGAIPASEIAETLSLEQGLAAPGEPDMPDA